ncbi:MAG: N-acetylmuramoyl-L-alanine amidase [Nitrospirae bacterium]|nr:N-acetylmuramoyl-L-alanine amidase [Nitrospirota bacterium]
MKKAPLTLGFFLLIFSYLISSAYTAEDIQLRYSMQNGFLRIVLQTETDRYVKRAKVYSTYSLVKVEFPGEFTLNAVKIDYEKFEYTKKGRNLYLNIKDLKWIKLLRLKSPPRLVIDAYLNMQLQEPKLKPEQKKEQLQQVKPSRPEEKALQGQRPQQPPGRKGHVKFKRIVIDPGHGGHNLGLYSSRYNEKTIALRVGRTVRYFFRKKGRRVYITRADDRYVSLFRRILYIKKRKPDLMISIHMTTSNNFAIYTAAEHQLHDEQKYLFRYSQQPHLKESRALARQIGEKLYEKFNINVLYRSMDVPILAYTDAPAVVIELPGAEFFEYTKQNIIDIARTIIEAVEAYEQS